MESFGVLIHGGSCLGAAVAFHMVELKRIHAEFASHAFERDAVADLLGCVVAHCFIVIHVARTTFEQQGLAFRRKALKPPEGTSLPRKLWKYGPGVCTCS